MSEEWVDLCEGYITCELCGKRFDEASFYQHLSEHSREEVLILLKMTEKMLGMTEEECEEFLTNLECNAFAEVIEEAENC